MPKPRLPQNKGLPKRWCLKNGAYRYKVPKGQEPHWDGKQTFTLGKTLAEAYRTWADRIEFTAPVYTIGQLLDRYAVEVIPHKSLNTQDIQNIFIRQLKKVFGHQRLGDIEPQDIYRYVDARSVKKTDEAAKGKTKPKGGPSVARREVSLLSHAYTKAVQWGYIKRHPFKGEIRLEGEKPRSRYVEDWEIRECLSLKPKRRKDIVTVVQAYINLKLLTGLRQSDLLRLTVDCCKEDGLHVNTAKTGKAIIYEWSDELREAVEHAKAVRPTPVSPFIFCTRRGKGYVNDRDKTESWKSIWQRFMARVMTETKITERFTEHDLRAKAASDAVTLEHARALLAHTDSRTTHRIYRRKAEIVKPTK